MREMLGRAHFSLGGKVTGRRRQDERRREGKKWEGRQMNRRKGEWGRQ